MYCTEHCTYDLIPGTLLGAHGTAESSAPVVYAHALGFLINMNAFIHTDIKL